MAPLTSHTSVHVSSFAGRSALQENNKGDPGQSDGPTADEEAELKELEFRARALESLVRARERQMKIEQGWRFFTEAAHRSRSFSVSLCMELSNKRSKKRGPVGTQKPIKNWDMRSGLPWCTCVVCAAGKMYGTELNDLERDSCGFKETLLSWMGPFFR